MLKSRPKLLLTASLLTAVAAAVVVFAPGLRQTDIPERPVREASPEAVAVVDGKPTVTVPPAAGQPPAPAIAGEVVVQTSQPEALGVLGAVRPAGAPDTFVISVSQSDDLPVTVAKVKSLPGVSNAGPNYVARAAVVPNDPQYGNQWALPKMALPTAWDRTTGATTTVIASLDTGVTLSHPDFAGKGFLNAADTAGNGLDDDANGYTDDANGMDFVNANYVNGKYVNDANGAVDDEGHGTLTSSVFAAATNNGSGMASVNWGAKVMPVKVLDQNGYGSFVDIANGIRYAADNGAKVINLSLGAQGVTSDFYTDQAIEYAVGKGVVLVAASGNDGSATTISYPAINPNLIAVGASTSSDAVATYSNKGPQLSVVAPGSSVLGADYAGSGYFYASGTSMASPQAAGVIGLLAGVKPSLTQAEARQMLQASADKPAGMNGQSRTDAFGYGRINADRAINLTPLHAAQYIRQSPHQNLSTGQQATVTVDYKNVGLATWSATGSNAVNLGTSGPRDRKSGFYSSGWSAPNRAGSFVGTVNDSQQVTPASSVLPGQTARFQFTVTAPPVGGSLRERFEPVVEGIKWLGDGTQYWDFNVANTGYAYQWKGQTSLPSPLSSGQEATVSIDLQNTGAATWRKDGLYPFRLGTARPLDRVSVFNNNWPSPNRLPAFSGRVEADNSVTSSDTIAPGDTARFVIPMKGPATPGQYQEYLRPVVENHAWLTDIGIYFGTTVPDTTSYEYQYVSQSSHPVMARNGTTSVTLNLKNTGGATWNSAGPNPLRLGTSRPMDRLSGFTSNGTAAGWVGMNRIRLARNVTDTSKNVNGETLIAPGETGQFEFTVVGSPPAGNYVEYFQPVVEGVKWLKDIGIYWNMTVSSPLRVGVSNQSTAWFTATAEVTLRNEAGTTYTKVPAGQVFGLTFTGISYVVDSPAGQFTSASPVRAELGYGHVMTVGNLAENGTYNRFRGNMYIKNGSAGTWLVNEVDLEYYLRGMGEVPDSWPLEAIKAQTTAARTYAARYQASPRNEIFNIYDNTSDQVYNGFVAEQQKPNHTTAADQTKGVVVKYNGALAQTYYSSDSGGATANNEDVWNGSPIPYLRAVADPYEKPDVWTKVVSQATLQNNFGHTGNIDTINILATYPGGRLKTIRLVTNGGSTTTHTFLADTNRSKLGTRSALINGLSRSGNDWVFHGRGFGHGIGMSQWGLYNQGLAGRNYQQMLSFYYAGVTFVSQ